MTAYQLGYLVGTLLSPLLYLLVIGTIYYFIKGRSIPYRQAIFNKWAIAASLVLFLFNLAGRTQLNSQLNASHEYPERDVQEFTAGCVDTAKASLDVAMAEKICLCSIVEIQKVYTYGEFKEFGAELQRSGELPTGVTDIMVSCAQQQIQ